MTRLTKYYLLFGLLGVMSPTQAQYLDMFSLGFQAEEPAFTAFSAIMLNGESLYKEGIPDGPLRLNQNAKGKLSVFYVDQSANKAIPIKPIGFKLAIKDWRTNTLWMYSEETLYEVDLAFIMQKCESGDSLIFMVVDPAYRLPRHEIVLGDGC